jgi:hypothetical protein
MRAEEVGASTTVPDSPARSSWAELARVVPRTAVFASKAARVRPDRPVPGLRRSPWTLAQVALDDLVVTVAHVRGRDTTLDFDSPRDDQRAEQRGAVRRLTEAGAFAASSVLFPTPPPVSATRLTRRRRYGVKFEHVSFESGYEPPAAVPGSDAWRAHEGGRHAHAFLLRHQGPRPWLVALHGYGTGEPYDLWWMGSVAAHRQLGVNVMNVVLPRHGTRGRAESDDRFPGLDPFVNLFGFAQAIWDIRRAIGWARTQGATRIGVHGISLGGYVAALLAGIEPGLDCVIAGTPVVDFGQLTSRHMARYEGDDHVLVRAVRDEAATALNRLVAPLTYPPLVAHEGRFIYAAVGDRMATPEQAVALWRHWDSPAILWVQTSHIGAALARQSRRFVHAALRTRGIATTPAPGATPSTP